LSVITVADKKKEWKEKNIGCFVKNNRGTGIEKKIDRRTERKHDLNEVAGKTKRLSNAAPLDQDIRDDNVLETYATLRGISSI